VTPSPTESGPIWSRTEPADLLNERGRVAHEPRSLTGAQLTQHRVYGSLVECWCKTRFISTVTSFHTKNELFVRLLRYFSAQQVAIQRLHTRTNKCESGC
jgi:hypothetical protein